jgi:gamma-aminobutyric acid type B receptor
VDKGLIISGLVLGVMIMLAALFFGLWTWCHRKSWVVQRSQPIFLGILCVGIALMASAVFSLSASAPPLSAEAMDFFCMFGYWSYTIGFGLTYSALISKMLRVNRIVVNQSLFSKVVVSPKDVMLPGVIIISCNVFVLMLWQVLAPLKYSRELLDTTFDHFGRYVLEIMSLCANSDCV